MRILAPVEEKIRRTIRDAQARDPLISVSGVQEELELKLNRTFDRTYLKRLCEKVSRESRVELDRAQIEDRMKFTRENYRMMRERLLEIIYWKPDLESELPQRPPINRDVIEAAKNLVMMDLALLSAEIANGMYKKPIEAIVKEYRYDPLPDEVRAVIIASWKRGGLLPAAAVEEMVPQQLAPPAQI
jgi:hypothetical protein